MMDEFNELYNLLSSERDDVKQIKEDYEKDISILLGRIRAYHIQTIDLASEYDIDTEFEKYKTDNIALEYNLHNDALEYKISLLQSYLQDLFAEKKFNDYRKNQEGKLTKNEYLEYMNNPTVKADKESSWYQDFMQQ